MPPDTVRVVARIKARPERVAEVRALLESLIEPTRREPGCVRYELLQNRNDPTDFTFVEEWESDPTFASHAASEHIREVGPMLRGKLAEPPDIRTYSVIG